MRIVATETWYGTDAGERVPAHHPLASFLICAAGATIDSDVLDQYPIHKDSKSERAEKPKVVEKEVAAKQIEKPPETKAIKKAPTTKAKPKPKR